MSTIDTSKVVFLQYPTVADPADVNRVVANTEQGALVNKALQKDRRIRLDKGSLGQGATTESPTPTTAPTSAAPTKTPKPTETSAPATTTAPAPSSSATPTATPGKGPVKVGSGTPGQTANQKTCSVGNG